MPGDRQQFDLQPDQWQVQDQQHHIRNQQAGNQPPDQLRRCRKRQRPRLQAKLLKVREHDCRCGRCGQAEGQQGRQRSGGGRRHEGQHHQPEIFARAKDQRQFDKLRRKERQRQGGQ